MPSPGERLSLVDLLDSDAGSRWPPRRVRSERRRIVGRPLPGGYRVPNHLRSACINILCSQLSLVSLVMVLHAAGFSVQY